jgi:hypothetical protein
MLIFIAPDRVAFRKNIEHMRVEHGTGQAIVEDPGS